MPGYARVRRRCTRGRWRKSRQEPRRRCRKDDVRPNRGGAAAHQISGLGGDDFLYGGGGGGAGVDALAGGDGDDILVVEFHFREFYTVVIGDHVIEKSGGGTDTVLIVPFAPVRRTIAGYTLTANVENGTIG